MKNRCGAVKNFQIILTGVSALLAARLLYWLGWREWVPIGRRGRKPKRGPDTRGVVYVREVTWLQHWYWEKIRWLAIELDFYQRNHTPVYLMQDETWQFKG